MKNNDISIGAFFKSLIGRVETKPTVDTADEFDAEYYRGDYGTVKKADKEFEVLDDEPVLTPSEAEPAYASRSTFDESADMEDFDFVDDGILIDEPVNAPVENEVADDVVEDVVETIPETPVNFIDNATLSDASSVADSIIDGAYTVVDLAEISSEEKVRMFDFVSGVIYACGGKVEKLRGGRTILILPEGKEIDDFKAAMAALNDDEGDKE